MVPVTPVFGCGGGVLALSGYYGYPTYGGEIPLSIPSTSCTPYYSFSGVYIGGPEILGPGFSAKRGLLAPPNYSDSKSKVSFKAFK